MFRILAALAVVFLCFSTLPAAAATSGIVRGHVLVDNAPKAGVKLTLKGEGSLLTTTSDGSGNYIFAQVPFGSYTLSAAFAGVPERTLSVDVASDSVVSVDFALGQLKVIANASVTAHGGAGGSPVSVNTIGRAQIAALPTNNSLDRVVQTAPGIVRFSYNEPVAHGFHGLTYEVDGAPVPIATSSNFSEIIDPKNVDSIEVFTGAYPAEYGGQRMGAIVNIISNRATDLQVPAQGSVTIGGGSYDQAIASFDEALKLGTSELFLDANSQRSARGLDTPTFEPIHDESSQSDQFLRFITPIGQRDTLAVDLSNQLAQFQIPINTDPHNPNDPVVSVPGTDDVQREYDRFANLNFTAISRDGNGVFQFIPWFRYTRIAFDGDLPKDVLATQPDPNTGLPVNLIGLRQDQRASYAGLRTSQLWTSRHHALKIGADLAKEFYNGSQTFAQLGQPNVNTTQAQNGWQLGLYAQDKWSPSQAVTVNYGLRYDHSTGYTSGWQLSPRIGVNYAPDAKNVVHFYYGRMYAAPQLEDVREACVALQGCPTVPVYDLKPESDAYWEMGVAHAFNSSITGYVNYFRRTGVNVLDTTQLLNTPLFAVFNNARGRVEGAEMRLDGKLIGGDSWFLSSTFSHAEAGGVSGSTFLFPPNQDSSFQPEDHDQGVASNGAFTHRFGLAKSWFATLQGEYGTGYPVQFQNGSGRLPTHLTFNLALGKSAGVGPAHSLGFDLDVDNLLNHQYIIKIANGFNTTQIATGRALLFRLTAPI